MLSPRTCADLALMSCHLTRMAMEAQAVIWMRLWGMGGGWNVTPGETRRMVTEKMVAAARARQSAARALASGAGPVEVMAAAIKPYRGKTTANLSRLSRRGPRLP